MSKYPRTFHMPFSPGGTSDDKKLVSMDTFLNKEVVISEKLDGSNCCLNAQNVFARSHNSVPKHPSFDYVKSWHQGIRYLIDQDMDVFGENCFAVHSIAYEQLPDYFFMFGVRQRDRWLSWDQTVALAKTLGCPTAPQIFRGVFKTTKELEAKVKELSAEASVFGGIREGVVLRVAAAFPDDKFKENIAKWVRANHVQTSDHWMFQEIVKQKISK